MNNFQINSFIHPTQFIIDLEPASGKEKRSLQQFMEIESNYDLAFSKAWEIFETFKDQPLVEPTQWLKLLDTIQQHAMSHLPKDEKVGTDLQGRDVFEKRKIGRATKNWYGLAQGGPCSNEEGIKDIIKKIWIDKEIFSLFVKTDDKDYAVIFNGFWMISAQSSKNTLLIKNTTDTRHKTMGEIFEKVITVYRQGKHPNGGDRLCMLFSEPVKDRETSALRIFKNYLGRLKNSDKQSTIKTIAITIRDLMQTHLYYDGNGRSLYILANLMFYQNKLPLFYPRNMCMFDGNSIDAMVQEILSGQERFTSYFGNEEQFSKSFKEYKLSVVEISQIFENNHYKFLPLEKAMKIRDFNLLLRQSAANEKYIPILEFLLNNISKLNIDIKSKGEKSGNVWDVAGKFKNHKALDLLKNFTVSE